MGWRDIKKAAKATVHATFMVPAIYLPDRALTPVNCGVRVHNKVDPMSMGMIDRHATITIAETQPRIVFAVADIANPLPRAYVFLSAQEVYRLGASDPAVDGYIAVSATRMDAASAQAIIAASGVDLTPLIAE